MSRASIIFWTVSPIHLAPVALYSLSRSVALPARPTHSWKSVAAWPSQPVTRCFLSFSAIFAMSSDAFCRRSARSLTAVGSSEALISRSFWCE